LAEPRRGFGFLQGPLVADSRVALFSRSACARATFFFALQKGLSMDPNTCFQEMVEAVEEADRQFAVARQRATALWDWLERGGCYPAGESESLVRTVISQVFMRTEEADNE